MLLLAPLGFGIVVLLLTEVPLLTLLLGPGHDSLTAWSFYRDTLLISLALFFGVCLDREPEQRNQRDRGED